MNGHENIMLQKPLSQSELSHSYSHSKKIDKMVPACLTDQVNTRGGRGREESWDEEGRGGVSSERESVLVAIIRHGMYFPSQEA